jgi:hypothetical protein
VTPFGQFSYYNTLVLLKFPWVRFSTIPTLYVFLFCPSLEVGDCSSALKVVGLFVTDGVTKL